MLLESGNVMEYQIVSFAKDALNKYVASKLFVLVSHDTITAI